MAAPIPPPAPRCCDICGASPAPFGHQLPGGRAARRPGTRPLMACAAPACRAAADARWRAAQAVARETPRPAPARDLFSG